MSSFGISITNLEKRVETLAVALRKRGYDVNWDSFRSGKVSWDSTWNTSYVDVNISKNLDSDDGDYFDEDFTLKANGYGDTPDWADMKANILASINKFEWTLT